jgi:predicted ATPase
MKAAPSDAYAVRNLLLELQVRLLTLIGSPGIGKTRLAIAVAGELQDAFLDGVCSVVLAPISDPALVIPTVAQALGVTEVGTEPVLEIVKRSLRDRQILLVLDNFEQVAPAAPAVAELLMACPGVQVMVTSRIALRVRGERLYPVPPLLLPDLAHLPALDDLACIPTVALFLERAQALMPGFAISEANAAAVAEICVRLDGLPLAIELAAARIRVFSPEALLARLSDPLKLLTGGARDLPARQQTLRAMVDWSYHLLDAGEQTLFARLGVFVGGCSLEAAEAICPLDERLPIDVADGVMSLLDKSLVRQVEGDDGEPRFTLLEMIREYALDRLAVSGEAEHIWRRHAAYYLALARMAEPQLRGTDQVAWMNRIEQELGNLRAAIDCTMHRPMARSRNCGSSDHSGHSGSSTVTSLRGVRVTRQRWPGRATTPHSRLRGHSRCSAQDSWRT